MDYTDPDGRPQMGNARCGQGHPLWLVDEGYAYCYGGGYAEQTLYWPWRFTAPIEPTFGQWRPGTLEDGTPVFVGQGRKRLGDVLAFIERDMEDEREAGQQSHIEAPSYSEWLATVS